MPDAGPGSTRHPPLDPRRWQRWWLQRHPRRDDWTLTQRNVYILPTRSGWLCGLLLLLLLIGSINYQLNLGYLLTFLLASAAVASMHSAHAALRGLQLQLHRPEPVHAGQPVRLRIELRDRQGRARHGLGLHAGRPATDPAAAEWHWFDLPASPSGSQLTLELALQSDQVGHHELPPLRIETRYPFGLFRAWSLWRPAARQTVWPAPELDPPPPPDSQLDGAHQHGPRPGTEYDGVRAYRRGDALTQIVWRKSAQALAGQGEPVSRDRPPEPQRQAGLLRWDDTAALGSVSARQQRLSAWILDAEAQGRPYAVELPGLQLPPACGERQRHAALQALTDLSAARGDARPDAASPFESLPPPRPAAAAAHLPREARDTLFLLAALGWTLLPQLTRVPLWCSGLTLAALAWRAWLAWRGAALPSRWLLLPVLLLAATLTWQDQRSLLGKEAGVTMLVLLAALKTLELRARRDHWVVFGLGFFLILANFLYSQSLATALLMLVAVLALLSALVLAHLPAGRPPLPRAATLALRQVLLGAPLLLLLFVFFPRIGPLWSMPSDGLGRTGLSERLSLGDVAELAQDDSLALRVRFDGAPPPREQLYFRGPVLALPEGPNWRADTSPSGPLTAPQPIDAGQGYELTLEPLRVHTLPLPEFTLAPPRLSDAGVELQQRPDLQWVSRRLLTERLQLRGVAHRSYRLSSDGSTPALERLLPPGQHPRSVQWARQLRASLQQSEGSGGRPPGADQLAAALLRHIRSGGYVYTLAPGLAAQGDALDDFWLDRKQGFCEHYATAFVVLMRAMDVPARIVTGYQGGQFNPIDGVLEVRQSDAHAWAEYWREGTGWVRIDPTSAVAPDRLSLGQRLRVPGGLIAGTLGQFDPVLAGQLRAFWSALDYRWNQWVIQHGQNRQIELLQQLGWNDVDLFGLGRALLLGLALLGLAGAGWSLLDARRGTVRDPWLRRWQSLQQRLRRHGLAVEPHEPPGVIAQRALQHWGPRAAPLAEALRRFEQWRYARSDPARPPGPKVLATAVQRQLARIARASNR